MRRLLIWFVVMGLAGSVLAGPNLEPKVERYYDELRMTVGEAIDRDYLDESARWEWGYVADTEPILLASGGGIDPRYGGTKHPVGSTGIRDMRLDLWRASMGEAVIVDTMTNGGELFGSYITRVDRSGDSLSIFRHFYDPAKAPPVMGIGAITTGQRATGWVQLACSDYDYAAPIRAATAPNITSGAGAAATTWLFDAPNDSTTIQSADSVVLVDNWYWHYAIGAEDTCKLEVHRRIRIHKGEPYILVRYKVRSVDMNNGANAVTGDSIRFVWSDVQFLGQEGIDVTAAGGDGVFHWGTGLTVVADIGYQNNFGEVRQEHLFTDFTDPVAFWLNIGNALAPGDTTMGQALIRDVAADSVWIDQGSGDAQTLGTFIAFNPNGTVPTEIFYGDGVDHLEPGVASAYDSTYIAQHDDAGAFNYDSTTVIDHTTSRGMVARSDPVFLDTLNYAVWEYAFGTVRFSDQDTPYWPAMHKIRFTDGTVLAIPYYRKR